MKILFCDTETGGLDPHKHSLLSVAFVIWEDGIIKASKEWFIDLPVYNIDPKAIKVNQIDFAKLPETTKPSKILDEYISFLKDNGFTKDEFPSNLAGHVINFDIAFLKTYLFNDDKNEFDSAFDHHMIDTSYILRFLYQAGKLPEDLSSFFKATDYFKIGDPKKRHTALADAIDTANLYTELLKLFPGNRFNL
jgi:DNA polymerase-3 subunit epsilon